MLVPVVRTGIDPEYRQRRQRAHPCGTRTGVMWRPGFVRRRSLRIAGRTNASAPTRAPPHELHVTPVHPLRYRRQSDHSSEKITLRASAMAESQIADPPDSVPEQPSCQQDTNNVCDSWQQMLQGILGVVMLFGAVAMLHYYAPMAAQSAPPDDLQKQVHELTRQVEQLKQDQAMPATVLNNYRASIGYIYGVYQVGFPNQRPAIRARVSGTGFLVGDHLLATNRHVAEPWYGDSESEALIQRGASAMLESLVVFFPNSPTPITLSPASVSKTADLAVLRAQDVDAVRGLP